MNIGRFCLLLATAILVFAPSTSRGITLGQVDTFEDGPKQGWSGSNAALVSGIGPAGNNDRYFQIFAAPSGGPEVMASNQSQWSGNYIAANVTSIEMDLKNTGPQSAGALSMRIAIQERSNSTAGYSSTTAFNLPIDNQWHHVSFSLAAGSMTGFNGPQPLASDLAGVVNFKIISSFSPQTYGDIGFGAFAVDNIAAVPEPSTICLAMSATVGLILFRRRYSKG